MNYIDIYESMRAVKMGWNPRVNLAHHGFRLGWTWTEFFLQISIRVDFWPDSSRLNSCPQIKGSHTCF